MSIKEENIKLTDLIDVNRLQRIQDDLGRVTGLSTVIFDPESNSITQQGLPCNRFCRKVIKSTPEGKNACRQCDLKAGEKAFVRVREGKEPKVYTCHAGLIDFCAPLMAGEQLLGYLFLGQVLDAPPDLEWHRQKAVHYQIPTGEYLAAIQELQVMEKDYIESAASILYSVANALSGEAYRRLLEQQKAKTLAIELEDRLQELTSLHTVSSSFIASGDALKTLQTIVEEAKKAMNIDAICLYLYDQQLDEFQFPITVGLSHEKEMKGPVMKSSVVGRVFASGKPHFASLSQQDELFSGPFVKREKIFSSAGFPLFVGNRPVGVLFLNYRTRHDFDVHERRRLEILANQVAIAVENARLYTTVAERTKELDAKVKGLKNLYEFASKLTASRGLREVAVSIVEYARKVTKADATCLWLYDNTSKKFDYGASQEYTKEEQHQTKPRSGGITEDIINTRKKVVVLDAESYHNVNPKAREMGIRSFTGYPLIAGKKVWGVLYVDFRSAHHFTSEEHDFIEALASLGAVALRDARTTEARNWFLAHITHDLKSPLGAIDMLLQRLKRNKEDAHLLEVSLFEIRRLTALVEDLLTLLRTTESTKPVLKEDVNICKMLDEILVTYSALLENRRVKVIPSIAQDAVKFLSDRDRIRGIFINLIDNAIKFSPRDGEVHVEFSCEGKDVVMMFIDKGQGMHPNLAERLRFRPPAELPPAWEEWEIGVGYTAVRRYIADLGGELDIHTEVGKGTKVIVKIPCSTLENT